MDYCLKYIVNTESKPAQADCPSIYSLFGRLYTSIKTIHALRINLVKTLFNKYLGFLKHGEIFFFKFLVFQKL